MLNFLRKYSRHWIIGAIIFAIAVVFVFTFGYGGYKSGPMQGVAEVNGEPILATAWQNQYKQLVKQFQERSRNELTEEMAKAMRLKEMARDQLIGQVMLLQAADRLGLTVSDAELRQQIESYPAFQSGARFNERAYELVLRRNGLTPADFEEQQRRELLIKKIVEEVGSLAKVSAVEVQETYNLNKEAVKVSYIVVTPDKFLAKQHPSDADVAKYYQDYLAEFRLPARARVSYFHFRSQDFQDKVKLSPAEVEDFIQSHRAEFSRPKVIRVRQILLSSPKANAKEKERLSKQAQELLQKLQGGEDFAKAAWTQSQDPVGKDKGGDLGAVSRGQHPPEWDRVAFGLQPGQIGRADTLQGIYLLKLEEVQETEKLPDSEAKATQRLKQEKAKPFAQEATKEARAALSQGTTAEITKKYGVSPKETPLIGSKDPVVGLPTSFNLAALQLKAGETGRVLEVPDGYAVMKSLEYQEEHVPPLEQIKTKVAENLKKQGAVKEAEQEANRLAERFKKGETLAQVAAAAGLPVKESNFFTRFEGLEGQREAEALTTAAFLLSKEHPYTERPLPAKDNFYLLTFKERRPADQAEFQKNREQLVAKMLEQKKQAMFQSWMEGEQRRAKIKLYELP